VAITTELPGRVSAFQSADIRPQVSGIILARLFEEGGFVQAGQQLYQIDPAIYQANLATAEAQLKRAEASLKSLSALAQRYRQLVRENAVSRQEVDDAVAAAAQGEAEVAIARAARDTAQINLDYTKVFSPISGRIGKSAVTPGALVTANQADPLALVQQLDPLYVDVSQSSAELMRLRQSMQEGKVAGTASEAEVELILDDIGQRYEHKGTLKFSDVTVDQSTGNVQIRAVFPNPDAKLLPGLFVRAVVHQGQLTNVLLVPQQAVTRAPDGQAMAWVVDAEDKAQSVPVKTLRAIKDKWVVSEGLNPGDRVIVEGAIKIAPGAPVRPLDLEDAAAAVPAPEAAETPPENMPAADADTQPPAEPQAAPTEQ
jgi:membrane fusion protein (multidrug efflux system)